MSRSWQDAIGQQKAIFHSLAIIRDTHDGEKDKSSGHNHLFNI
jgi:hypothetical protein